MIISRLWNSLISKFIEKGDKLNNYLGQHTEHFRMMVCTTNTALCRNTPIQTLVNRLQPEFYPYELSYSEIELLLTCIKIINISVTMNGVKRPSLGKSPTFEDKTYYLEGVTSKLDILKLATNSLNDILNIRGNGYGKTHHSWWSPFRTDVAVRSLLTGEPLELDTMFRVCGFNGSNSEILVIKEFSDIVSKHGYDKLVAKWLYDLYKENYKRCHYSN